MEKVLIIGGFGNIGLGITRKFVELGYDVTVMDRQQAEDGSLEGVEWIQCDRSDADSFGAAVKGKGFEYVVDMACFTKDQAAIVYENLPDIKRLIAVSSGAAYGALHGREVPIREDMIMKPKWQYGVIKKEMEDYLFDKFRKNGYPVTVFRPSVTYGRQKTIVRQIAADNSWVDRIRKGKPIVVGNPYILRSFLFADDAAAAFTGALNHPCTIGQAYNLGGMKPYDWGTYHRTMMKVLGREVEMVEVPLQVMEACPEFEVSEMITESYVFNAFYSGEKIARDIPEFSAQTDLETGLRKAVEYLDAHNLVPDSDTLTWEDELIKAQKQALHFWVKKP